MNTVLKLRNVCFIWLVALCAIAFTGCEEDKTEGGNLRIYYPEVANIGPSMSFISGTPTYYGAAPTAFEIVSITLDDVAITSESFSINAESGAVSIANTAAMKTGVYKLTISCKAGGASHTFQDAFVVKMLPSTPLEIEVSEPVLEIPYDEINSSDASVSVKLVGESVSIKSYELVQPEGLEYFSISTKGVVTPNAAYKGDKLPGVYPLSIKITTHAGSMIYDNLLTAKITSQPLLATYTPASGRMELDMSFQSAVPTLKGSPEGVAWMIRQVTPQTDKITIDASTGCISVAEGNGLPLDQVYTIDLSVTNDYGSVDFDAAYALSVIGYIIPIDPATFAYNPVTTIQGGEFTAEKKAGFVGDDALFSLGTLPAGTAGQISIDAETGAVWAVKGHSIPVGTYPIPVKATNSKGEVEITLTLIVEENPYYFSTITYGNNLGLTPETAYANQFHFAKAADFTELMPTTDAKSGTTLSWSIKIKHQCKGSTIDPTTGQLTLSGFSANNGGLILVTATAGEGQVGETSVTVPVFFSFLTDTGSLVATPVPVSYKPFVFQVNPRKGGTSTAPVISGVTSSQLIMDYRRTFNYYNIAGPATHIDGQPSVANSFMNQLWKSYNASIGSSTVNTSAKDPLSYYVNKARLSSALAYVDASTKSIVLNANKWIGEDGMAANGAMIGQITFNVTGDESTINNGSQIFPVWIWLDEKF